MKMIASRQLTASPGKVWKDLEREGSLVITKDGVPCAILLPTSEKTLLQDLRSQVRERAQRAVSGMRRKASASGISKISLTEVTAEIRSARQGD
ncbi:MAG: hypothetical protein HC904_02100 [Blastochloris sp.]|nr:hypothetical protein [Blastochloris sp.]